MCVQQLQNDVTQLGDYNLVAQVHVRYSDETENYINKFKLKPIVLVRDLFDVVPSLLDHHKIESTVYPMAVVPPDIVEWDFDRAAMFVTRMVIPWYFNFYVSWQFCDQKIVIRYEELLTDPVATVKKICGYWNIDISETDIIEAIKRAEKLPTRRNIGQAGRGRMLHENEKALIREMANFYKGVDFSLIGL